MRMQFLVFVCAMLALALGLSSVGFAGEEYEVYGTELPSEVLQAASNLFREYKTPDASLIATSANLAIERETSISISFVGEGASYRSSVGFFRMGSDSSVIDRTVVFPNFSGTGPGLAGGGSLNLGDTVDIGTFAAGEQVGFFLIADGYRKPNNPVWYTAPELNSDGKDHDAAVWLDGLGVLIGFEDLTNLGDRDYNDALLFVGVKVSAAPEEVPSGDAPEEPEAEAGSGGSADEEAPGGDLPKEPEAGAGDTPDEEAPAPQAPALEPTLEERVSQFMGLGAQVADSLVREFGPAHVARALNWARDVGAFWTALYGYEMVMGGAGGSAEGAVVQIDFQLFSPLTGEPVQSVEPISLTIVRVPANDVLEIRVVEFDAVTASYSYELPVSSLPAGDYDLYVGLVASAQSKVLRISVPASGN